jgi:hypothetical protein
MSLSEPARNIIGNTLLFLPNLSIAVIRSAFSRLGWVYHNYRIIGCYRIIELNKIL